jgi:RNA polymerase sigma-70 factor (ECF subfamily)
MHDTRDDFSTTHWTQILIVRAGDECERRQALERLCSRYWKPVYSYLRRKGYSPHDAEDLVQGFFHEIVVDRNLVEEADRARGRFRTFLLTALNRYLVSMHRRATARKRRPPKPLVSIHTSEIEPSALTADASPEKAFERAWAAVLLDHVLAELRKHCQANGQDLHWEVFAAKVLEPIFSGGAAPSLADICSRHGIPDETTASNMITTVKRSLQRTMHKYVRSQVDTEAEVANEIDYLVQLFSDSGTGS